MKVLVTGGRGFIGSFLVEKLLETGYEVRCLLRSEKPGWLAGLRYEWCPGDLSDGAALERAVDGVDYVFHVAALTKSHSKRILYQVNVGGTEQLLRAMRRMGTDPKRFVLISSQAAAGPSASGQPVTEADPPQPVSAYGMSKLKAEQIVTEFGSSIPFTIIRPPTVYGPRDVDVYQYFKYASRGWLPVLSGGPRYLSAVYVKDLVEGIVLAAENQSATGQTYFLCNDDFYSWEQFGEIVASVLGVKTRKMLIPVPLVYVVSLVFELAAKVSRRATLFNFDKFREFAATHWICSNAKAQQELNFQCHHSLEAGVRETALWYEKEGWL